MKKMFCLLLVPMLFGCSTVDNEVTRVIPTHEYSEISNLTIMWGNILNYENEYYVYCYSETCLHCREIKNEIIDIALTSKDKIYFCKDEKINVFRHDSNLTIGATKVENVYISGFPTLLGVKNKTIELNLPGANKIISKLRQNNEVT